MTAALEGGEWSAARPGRTLPPEKTRYSLYRRLGGPHGRSGRAENLVPTRIWSRTVQPVVSPYADYSTRPTVVARTQYNLHDVWRGLYDSNPSPFSALMVRNRNSVRYYIASVSGAVRKTTATSDCKVRCACLFLNLSEWKNTAHIVKIFAKYL